MRNKRAAILVISTAILFSFSPPLYSAMNDYCSSPPFISSAVAPNIFFVTDVSGSMEWPAYYDWATGSPAYSSTTTYEGYFTPTAVYKRVNDIWTETSDPESCTGPTLTCSFSWFGQCWGVYYSTISGTCSGNKLNYALMSRIDVVRWAITGGRPTSCASDSSCNSSSPPSSCFDASYCDPELYNQPGNSGGGKVGTVCDANGCTLLTNGDLTYSYGAKHQIKVPWSRINDSLVNTFKNLAVKPRMGGFFYSGTGVRTRGQVYVGDFTGPNSTSTQFPFMNLITALNATYPSSATPTGPAMWDAFNYFKQASPQYNGISVQSGSGDRWKNPMYVCDGGGSNCTLTPCAKNFVILLSDGQWNYGGPPTAQATCSIDTGYELTSADPVVPAYKMHMGFTNAGANVDTSVNAVYTIGLFLGGTGAQSLQNVAMYGAFDKTGKTWPDSLSGYPAGTCYMNDCGNGKGSACTSLPSSSPDWDSNANNVPDTYYNASTASAIKDAILNAVLDALRRASSGTAVSMLSSSEGSGANLLQAVFYPKRTFGTTEIDWTSEMQNLWYYIDPYLQNSTIREDTTGDKKLDLTNDYIAQFYFDATDNTTKIRRYRDSDGDGDSDAFIDAVGLDNSKNLWEAGELLWSRTSARTLYTYDIPGTSATKLMNFSTANEAALRTYMQAANATEGTKIINYVHGTDQSGYRNRTATIGGSSKVWKLGDIINSTPRLQSNVRLNSYNLESPNGYNDTTYSDFTKSSAYKTRGMVYVGANDGMLHAFKIGTLDVTISGYKAQLCEDSNSNGECDTGETTTANLGKEEWAYIPKNVLPYLKYLADPNYCHLYYVDGAPYLFDASLAIDDDTNDDGSNDQPADCTAGAYWKCKKSKDSWRTILIGSMGLGGACRNSTTPGSGNFVKTPIDGVGYSSYFALDVTDPLNPTLLWEFSDPALGYATSGPAVMRIGSADKNGRWYAVFASGPTGPIDTANHQFLGKSDQNLKIFVLDLKTGTLLRTIDTGIQEAFGGSLFNSPIDFDKWNPASSGYYKDDAAYLGYSKKTGSTWTDGGVLRLATKEDDPDNGAANWAVSTVISGIGPVTAAAAKLQDRNNHKLWLHFGTGRYFYKTLSEIDDAEGQRRLFGIKEPCYNKNSIGDDIDNNCTDSVTFASLDDKTTSPSFSEPTYGWYINLDASSGSYKAERFITDPLAVFTGTVYFTTFSPNNDVCEFGGNTYLWAVNYKSGASSTAQQGKAMLQVSTGSIEEKSLSSSFTERDSRRTSAIKGTPPKGQGLSVIISPKPMKRILHIKEK